MRIATIILSLVVFTVFSSSSHASPPKTLEGTAVKVLDGDTFLLLTGTRTVKVRLFGLDAPEVRRKLRPGQPFGAEAKQALEKKVEGKKISIDVVDVDKNLLVIGMVKTGGRDIDREMIEEGWAWAYRQRLREPYSSRYVAAENKARKMRLGLWRQENPQPPWSFRFEQKIR
ncbi:thermonuclease family protein [Geobacter hydrogenophilus]|uniref:Nuclease n=1 Tax=Geobacter hydrogenophilus TaxID=40983 RepID=A0A9W6G3S1_9BACT|nr:thermonuclease family protein [Geobacter hydrogenophilus]MBT0892469.1 thermonuclease family protein [Geobacter hydrogenophilus]GLI39865.1 nuclease [Geobacter hydrogenophilus]